MSRLAREQRVTVFFFYFGVIMGVLYIITGILLIAFGNEVPQLAAYLPGNSKWLVGTILIGYGAFRIARRQYLRRRVIHHSFNDNEQILDSDEHP